MSTNGFFRPRPVSVGGAISLIVLIALALRSQVLHAAEAGDGEANRVLQRCAAQFDGRPLIVKCDNILEFRSSSGTSWSKVRYELRTDGKRVESLAERAADVPAVDQLDSAAMTDRIHLLADGATSYFYTVPIKPGALGHVGVSRDPQRIGKQLAGLSQSVVLGVFANDLEPITTSMRQDQTLSLAEGQPPGHTDTPCHILEAQTRHGHYRLWIDARSGTAIRHVEITKKSGDLFMGRPLASAGPATRPARAPRSRVDDAWPIAVTYTFDVKSSQQVDGQSFPAKSESSLKMSFPDGSSSTTIARMSWRQIDLHPDFSKLNAFKLNIPDGASASPSENPAGIRHIWKGGEIVPATSENTPANPDGL